MKMFSKNIYLFTTSYLTNITPTTLFLNWIYIRNVDSFQSKFLNNVNEYLNFIINNKISYVV